LIVKNLPKIFKAAIAAIGDKEGIIDSIVIVANGIRFSITDDSITNDSISDCNNVEKETKLIPCIKKR
jgi:hypothetical protein